MSRSRKVLKVSNLLILDVWTELCVHVPIGQKKHFFGTIFFVEARALVGRQYKDIRHRGLHAWP